jgi:hypothetical protein
MAQSNDEMRERLGQLDEDMRELKSAVVQIGGILVDQSARIDHGFRINRDEITALREEARAGQAMLGERLDRLIAATLRQGTLTADRLMDIELRLSRLEQTR